ncbi:hypothetical protein CAP35_09865 [Chitinophagaceae bacterium IBVUCB1]|nr:hypothetical protein CAP35_09865 [Chitinophagaceae bacterium IBVUCB1]
MINSTTTPKVFISYSWKPAVNKEKVKILAERLSNDGVHVIIDIWDLKEGQDKYHFMEQMVNSDDVKRVLLICNKEYSDKANEKHGGVGIESTIISDEIYNYVEQTKFLPVIFEYDGENKPCTPTFVKSRIFIDLSNDEIFEENYENLLRNIFDAPQSRRPAIGTPPPYVTENTPIYLPTAHKVAALKKALIDEKRNVIIYVKDYYTTFINSIKLFIIDIAELNIDNYDNIVVKKIDELIYLRNDFIDFLDVYLSYSVEIDCDEMFSFFEKLLEEYLRLGALSSGNTSFEGIRNDHYRFFCYELFLYFSSIMIDKDRYTELGYILNATFNVYKEKYDRYDDVNFDSFSIYNYTLNELRNKKLGLRRISITADLVKERANSRISFKALQETDVLLYYISILKKYYYWFPETSVYSVRSLAIMQKASSSRFLFKILPLFGFTNKEELEAAVNSVNMDNRDNIQRFNYDLPLIKNGLNIENLGVRN